LQNRDWLPPDKNNSSKICHHTGACAGFEMRFRADVDDARAEQSHTHFGEIPVIVSMWMSRDAVTVEKQLKITEAAALMLRHQVRRLPVVQSAGDRHLVGILTKSDIYAAFPAEINPFSVSGADQFRTDVTVQDIMTRDPATTTPETPIESAAQLMLERDVGGLPVMKHGLLVGMITESDIFRAFVELIGTGTGEARISFYAAPQEDVLNLVLKAAQKSDVRLVSILSSHHDNQPMCVVRVTGKGIDDFIQSLWNTHHPPLNVVRT
jgi:acetoin utilization protein AcuB